MMPESGVSKVMRFGVVSALGFMFAGVVMSFFGLYDEHVTMQNFFRNGAGIMYIGTYIMISTPALVLIYLSIYFIFAKPVKYAVYCIAILVFLLIVILTRI